MHKLLLKVKKNLHFYTLSEQTPIIAIINKISTKKLPVTKCDERLHWLEWRNQQKQPGYFSVNKVFRKTAQNSQKNSSMLKPLFDEVSGFETCNFVNSFMTEAPIK